MIVKTVSIFPCRILLLFILFAWLVFSPEVIVAQNAPVGSVFYVDNNHPLANDGNAGTADQPWLTIQHAINVAQSGDSVVIMSGVYAEPLLTQHSGDETGGYIVFSGQPAGEVIIDGTGSAYHTGIRIYHSFIKFRGLEIRNWENTGIWVMGAGFFEIHQCEVHQMRFGIGISGGSHDFLLLKNDIHHFDYYGVDISPSGDDFCYNGRIIDCKSHSCRDPLQNVDGFALGHGEQRNFVFRNCQTYDVFDGFDISSAYTTLSYCDASDCANSCYKLWAHRVELFNCIGYNGAQSVVQCAWIGSPTKTTIRNCTFHGAGTYTLWIVNSSDTLELFNSIIAGGDNIGLCFGNASAANYYGNNNVFQNNNTSRTINVGWSAFFSTDDINQGLWANYSGQDELSAASYLPEDIFVNPDKPDLHPKPGGVAIDKGNLIWAPDDDFHGFSRPIGEAPDIGAYESQLSVWTGSVSNDWFTANNWEENLSPLPASNVLIPNTAIDPLITGETEVANILINPGGNLTIGVQGLLTVSGSIINQCGINGLILQSLSGGTGSLLHHSEAVQATVERFIPGADWGQWDDGWHMISSPVVNQSIYPEFVSAYTSGGEDFYQWDEPGNVWINIKNATGTGWTPGFESCFESGKGYLIASQTDQMKVFTGVLHSGDVVLNDLTFTPGVGKNRSWNLIGNPYPCGLEWYTDWITENIGGVACAWSEENRSYSPLSAGDIIPHGNGFMVSVSGTGGGSLTIPAAKRVLSERNWLKETRYPVIRLFAVNQSDHSAQECQLRFHPEATEGFDLEFDGGFLPGHAPLFYSRCTNENLMVNSLPLAGLNREIPLFFQKDHGNSFRIHADISHFSYPVFLFDRHSGSEVNLLANQDYIFTSDENQLSDRFVLRIGNVGIHESGTSVNTKVFSKPGLIIVKASCENVFVEIYSMIGQCIKSLMYNGLEEHSLEFNCEHGYYLVKVRCGDTINVSRLFVE